MVSIGHRNYEPSHIQISPLSYYVGESMQLLQKRINLMVYYILAKIHCNPVTYTEGHDGLLTSYGYITFFPY